MKQTVSKEAKCPFYRKEDSLRLFCDGWDHNSVIVFFSKPEGNRTHRKKYCYSVGNYHNCPLAEMLLREYDKTQN